MFWDEQEVKTVSVEAWQSITGDETTSADVCVPDIIVQKIRN